MLNPAYVISVLDTHHTPKLSFLLVPKQETDSKQNTLKNNTPKPRQREYDTHDAKKKDQNEHNLQS